MYSKGGCTTIATIKKPFTIPNGNTTLHAQDTSRAAYASSAWNSLAYGSDATRCQNELMDAITASPENIVTVRNILSAIVLREDLRKPVLLAPNASARHKLRTPLMAAAATGQMTIVGKHGLIQPRRVVHQVCSEERFGHIMWNEGRGVISCRESHQTLMLTFQAAEVLS